MNFILEGKKEFFILGAGASMEYGLPRWADLKDEIIKALNKNSGVEYLHGNEIKGWLQKVGYNKEYPTIDACIKFESASAKYHENGAAIENELFAIIKHVFASSYAAPDNSWIKSLNNYIKNSPDKKLEHRIAFVNYNYDDVLYKNFLNYSYLGSKEKLIDEDRLEELSRINVPCLHPNGLFYSTRPFDTLVPSTDTFKSNKPAYIDAVSCHESRTHRVGNSNLVTPIKLSILGLGGGLKTNLDNLNIVNVISEIDITISPDKNQGEIIKYLSKKFELEETQITVHNNCEELIQRIVTNSIAF